MFIVQLLTIQNGRPLLFNITINFVATEMIDFFTPPLRINFTKTSSEDLSRLRSMK